MTIASILPEYFEPAELAAHLGWSERSIRETARKIGACHIVGRKMMLTADDVKTIMEATRPCPSKSTNEEVSGTTGGLLPGGSYADLVKQRTKKPPKGSPPKSKRDSGKVILMDRKQF